MLKNILKYVQRYSDDHNSQSGLNITDLPNELLSYILTFVSPLDLVQSCSLVSKQFHNVVSSPNFWSAMFSETYGREISIRFHQVLPSKEFDFKAIMLFRPFERNLIGNNSGELKSTKEWTVTANGGNRIIVETAKNDSLPGMGTKMTFEEISQLDKPFWLEFPSQHCFATSFQLCEKYQVVDLFDFGLDNEIMDVLKPPIAVGEWNGCRWDCGCEYRIEVKLLGSDDEPLERFNKTVRYMQWSPGYWQPIWHVFQNYQKGVRKVVFKHSGVDTQFWAGHYGAKFSVATVKVLLATPNSLQCE